MSHRSSTYPTGRAIVLQGDARRLPVQDNSVDLVVTSPPFLNLRSYVDGGVHMEKQIGTGARDEYLHQMWDATAEMVRVLKPTGSLFVELGDSYTDKCLNMTPHRYAIGCVDRLGLYKRAEIIWSRPNGLPESVTDRVRRAHSVVFHFTLQPRYYSAVDEVREPHAARTHEQAVIDARAGLRKVSQHRNAVIEGRRERSVTPPPNPLGKLPGSVWTIPTSPLSVPEHLGVDHFAAYPPELVRRIVLGWSPRGVCVECGEGRRPVADKRVVGGHLAPNARDYRRLVNGEDSGGEHWKLIEGRSEVTITGYACACPEPIAPTTPGVVLDPFGGTGTSSLVASCYGRIGISVDLSHDYSRLARWRTSNGRERARVLRQPKPEPVDPEQLDLLGGLL
jgi:hypothetical protein